MDKSDTESWVASAACAGSEVDFHATNPEEIQKALDICASCPVRKACIQEALDNSERMGVWGGATGAELRRAQSIDLDGKAHVFFEKVRCPYCGPRSTRFLKVISPPKRTRTHVKCTNCGINFWTRKVINRKGTNF